MPSVTLKPATAQDFPTIENMMQFYMYDFSQWLPISIETNGKFTISPKAPYLSQAATKPYLIEVDGRLAGFAIVDQEVHLSSSDHSLGYFFIARQFQSKGFGALAAIELIKLMPGCWEIFYFDDNHGAARFWKKVIAIVTDGRFAASQHKIDGLDCTLFQFNSPNPSPSSTIR